MIKKKLTSLYYSVNFALMKTQEKATSESRLHTPDIHHPQRYGDFFFTLYSFFPLCPFSDSVLNSTCVYADKIETKKEKESKEKMQPSTLTDKPSIASYPSSTLFLPLLSFHHQPRPPSFDRNEPISKNAALKQERKQENKNTSPL